LNDVRRMPIEWITRYNALSPHEALGDLPPPAISDGLMAQITLYF
jgi:hypothetical protein